MVKLLLPFVLTISTLYSQDTVTTNTLQLELIEKTDTTSVMDHPASQETISQTEKPVAKINLQETIPEPPTMPITQTILGSILTVNGVLVVIFYGTGNTDDTNSPYNESQSDETLYFVGGSAMCVSGIALLCFAVTKWKSFKEWKIKYQPKSMNTHKINISVNF